MNHTYSNRFQSHNRCGNEQKQNIMFEDSMEIYCEIYIYKNSYIFYYLIIYVINVINAF